MSIASTTFEPNRIKSLRRGLGLSQIEFAALLGVSNISVNRWEHGRVQPEAKMRSRLEQLEQQRALSTSLPRAQRASLPVAGGSFIGRAAELEYLARLLETRQLVTISGPAGSGKSRTSIELGNRLSARYPDGIWFVDLSAVLDSGLVHEAAARSLGAGEGRDTTAQDRLTATVAGWKALVILDNCEHVVKPAAEILQLLDSHPAISVIATSRVPLGLPTETLHVLGPLDAADAASLFLDQARPLSSVDSNSDADAKLVDEICRRLDRLPLAIELAAGRSHLLTLQQLLERLSDRFSLLRSTAAPSRTSALETAIDWSYEQLSESERRCFRSLGVFAGRFDIVAVEAICSGPSSGANDVLSHLEVIARHSMLTVHRDESQSQHVPGKFQLLETIREYALVKLIDENERDEMAARHAGYYLDVAREASRQLNGPNRVAALGKVDADLDNLNAALAWAIERLDVEHSVALASTLWPYWHARGEFSKGLRWIRRVLDFSSSIRDRDGAELRTAAATFLTRLGEDPPATELIEESLAICRELRDRAGEARGLDVYGLIAQRSGDLDRAASFHNAALEIWRVRNDAAGMAESLTHLGQIANIRGDETEAERLYLESWELIHRLGDPNTESALLNDLGDVLIRAGRTREALNYYKRALSAAELLGQPDRIAALICNLAELRVQLGDTKQALTLAAEGVARYRKLGNRAHLADALYILGTAFDAATKRDEALSAFQEAISLYQWLGNEIYAAQTIEAAARTIAKFEEPALAAKWLGAAATMREKHGVESYALFDYQGLLDSISESIGDERLAFEMTLGRAIPPAQAILNVVTYEPPQLERISISASDRTSATRYSSALTKRQQEVLRLVASGFSNRQVANQLELSERTVERHLSAIYTALDVSGRSSAVAYAVSSGVLAHANS